MKSYKEILLFYLVSLLVAPVVSQQPIVKWQVQTLDMAFGNAALADVDKDQLPEIVFSTYRNDERIMVLNAEDGSVLWEYHTNGCNDVAPLIYDVDADGELEIVLPGSCNPKTFCFTAATGALEWVTDTYGSDSPPTVADLDNDGIPEILHGEFGGWVICLNGEDGSVLWHYLVDGNSWIQTAPTILDVDGDEYLDFVVGNWSFGEDHRVFAFRGVDHTLLWVSDLPNDVMYHGASHTDIDGDGKEELVIGDYSGKLMVLNAENGSLAWDFSFASAYAMAAPTVIADMDQDGDFEIVCIDWYQVGVLDHEGHLVWQFNIPGNSGSFRGPAVADINADDWLDLVFATSDGKLYGIDGMNGLELWHIDLRDHSGQPDFSFDHAPVMADFDADGLMDVFVVGGHAEYPDLSNNYGIGYAVSLGVSGGPDWPMFRRDARRTACVCDQATEVDDLKKPDAIPKIRLKNNALILENGEGREFMVEVFTSSGQRVDRFRLKTAYLLDDLYPGIYFYQMVSKEGKSQAGKLFVPGF
jgi:outer membrane protein assembly factor BamB